VAETVRKYYINLEPSLAIINQEAVMLTDIIKSTDLIFYQLAVAWAGMAVGTVIGFWLGVLRESAKR
jgi:hypothetical protein